MLPDLLQICTDFILVYILFIVITFAGNIFLRKFGAEYFSSIISTYGRIFTSFFCGLLIAVYMYSVIVTMGLTINLLILPIFYYLFIGNNKRLLIKAAEHLSIKQIPFLEIAFISFIVVVLLHLFPENQYKQADAFYYLKIAESMNATGEENTSHYFNLFSSDYHGMEPYHYFEIWITAFIIRITNGFYASINIQRFVTQGLLLTALIIGLYYLAEGVIKQKIGAAKKVFCWSLLFILPNFIFLSSSLYKLFISDFEGNVLERPNFRIIYFMLIPVILKTFNHRPVKGRTTYLLLLISLVSFQFTVVIIPAIILYNVYAIFIARKDELKFNWLHIGIFCGLFAIIYLLFGVHNIPTMYEASVTTFLFDTIAGWKFILFSIVTSLLYILLIMVIMFLPLMIMYRNVFFQVLKDCAKRLQLLLFIGLIGLIIARVLYLKDNAYQFLFVAHIITTIFIWIVYLKIFEEKSKARLAFVFAGFLSLFWFVKAIVYSEQWGNIFKRTASFSYKRANYNHQYIDSVDTYIKSKNGAVGGFVCDSVYYSNLYYSLRNPNVYFLPITYLMAARHNNNFEFCLSKPSLIIGNEQNRVYNDYLSNAVQRSFFNHFLQTSHLENYDEALQIFIDKYQIDYLIYTRNATIPAFINAKVKKQFLDVSTGEKFLVIQ